MLSREANPSHQLPVPHGRCTPFGGGWVPNPAKRRKGREADQLERPLKERQPERFLDARSIAESHLRPVTDIGSAAILMMKVRRLRLAQTTRQLILVPRQLTKEGPVPPGNPGGNCQVKDGLPLGRPKTNARVSGNANSRGAALSGQSKVIASADAGSRPASPPAHVCMQKRPCYFLRFVCLPLGFGFPLPFLPIMPLAAAVVAAGVLRGLFDKMAWPTFIAIRA